MGESTREIYVQLMSNASTSEFPDNKANSFKNRLPNPLQLRESGWKVGVSDLSFPSAVRKMDYKDAILFQFWWMVFENPRINLYAEETVQIKEGDLEFTLRTGTEFMNMIRDRYMMRLRDQTVHDLQMFKKQSNANDPTEMLYTIMRRAENGECVIDNSKTCTTLKINGNARYPQMSIGMELAKKMKWIKMGTLQNGQPGYVMGPNLRKEFPTEVVPNATDLIVAANNGDEIFYTIDSRALHLSCFINWVFTDLDRSYEEAFCKNRRSLFVYSNEGQSMVTGNQVTDLLKQVHYDPNVVDFQPRHILYLPVRTSVLDIVETQVSESDGKLVDFASGVTTITLHFKRRAIFTSVYPVTA